MKLQHIAAAVALAAAGTANAAVADFNTGNSTFFLVAYDTTGGTYTQTGALFDLGYFFEDIAGTATGSQAANGSLVAPGKEVVWNFNNNTVTHNGILQNIGNNSWSTAFAKLLQFSDAGQIRWTVGAGDNIGIGSEQRFLITAGHNPSAAQLNSQNVSNTNNLQNSNTLFLSSITNKGTLDVAGVDNGANTFAAQADGAATGVNGYMLATDIFQPNWKGSRNVLGSLNQVTAASGSSMNLWLADGTGAETRVGQLPANFAVGPTILNRSTTLKFDAAAGTLTMTTIPEPTTYALAIAGLALAGVAARRRRAA